MNDYRTACRGDIIYVGRKSCCLFGRANHDRKALKGLGEGQVNETVYLSLANGYRNPSDERRLFIILLLSCSVHDRGYGCHQILQV